MGEAPTHRTRKERRTNNRSGRDEICDWEWRGKKSHLMAWIENGICDRIGSERVRSRRGKEGKPNRMPNDRMHEIGPKGIE
jgi:hypothetical protein